MHMSQMTFGILSNNTLFADFNYKLDPGAQNKSKYTNITDVTYVTLQYV
jgi:hypothetical protein